MTDKQQDLKRVINPNKDWTKFNQQNKQKNMINSLKQIKKKRFKNPFIVQKLLVKIRKEGNYYLIKKNNKKIYIVNIILMIFMKNLMRENIEMLLICWLSITKQTNNNLKNKNLFTELVSMYFIRWT